MSGELLDLEALTRLDPGPVAEVAERLRGASEVLRTVVGLLPETTDGWDGAASAAAFVALGMRRSVVVAAESSFGRCAAALAEHARVLEDVSRRAWQVVLALADVERWAGDPTTAGLVALERDRWVAAGVALAGELEASAARAEAVVGGAAADAPDGPGLTEQASDMATSLALGVVLGLESVAVGLWTLARTTSVYAQADPGGSARTHEQLAQVPGDLAEHPVETAEVLLDVDMLRNDPITWGGQLVPGLLGAVISGGATSVGGVAGAGARAVGAGARAERAVAEVTDQGVAVAGKAGPVDAAARERAARERAAGEPAPRVYRTPANPMAPEMPAAEGSRRRDETRAARGGSPTTTRPVRIPGTASVPEPGPAATVVPPPAAGGETAASGEHRPGPPR